METKCLSEISHENIITLYGVSKNTNIKLIHILEYSQCGSLHNFLYLPKEGYIRSLKYSDSLKWMYQLALVRLVFISFPTSQYWYLHLFFQGMAYLHQSKIIHRDLKPQNLLLFNNFQTLKICDFGTVIEMMSIYTAPIGTIPYMAPEVVRVWTIHIEYVYKHFSSYII